MEEGVLFLGCFVDDLVYYGTTDAVIARFKSELYEHFKGGITGGNIADTVLGLTISYNNDDLTCSLGQQGYVRKICERFGIDDKSRNAERWPRCGEDHEDGKESIS